MSSTACGSMTAVFLATMPGRPACIAVIAALALAFASCSSSPGSPTVATNPTTTTTAAGTTPPSTATSTTAAGTQEVRFDPFSAQGTLLPTEQVTVRVSGTCVTPGVAGTSSYRCFAQPDSDDLRPLLRPARRHQRGRRVHRRPRRPRGGRIRYRCPARCPSGSAGDAPVGHAAGQRAGLHPRGGGMGRARPLRLSHSRRDQLGRRLPRPAAGGPVVEPACQAQERATSAFSAARVVKVWT